jgi:outer membrane protein OmpA-like peptidoglycan-associated protein
MMKAGFGLCVAALAMVSITGCTTKNYVKKQTAPLIDRTNQLEEKTQANNRSLHDVDDRAQAGIKQAQGAADSAAQSAQNASKAAGDAETAANDAVHRADSLASVINGLDSYRQVGDVTVTFGFNKSNLTKNTKEQLDGFGQQLSNASNFILEVTGGTDSIGSANYNYALSDRRADAVVQYLISKYNVAPRRFYLIGMGKDIEVAPNNTAEGRQQNRRVQVRMLSNAGQQNASAPANPGSGQ